MIEIDPELKQELYQVLRTDGMSLKQWFLEHVEDYLRHRGQMSLQLLAAEDDEPARKYG